MLKFSLRILIALPALLVLYAIAIPPIAAVGCKLVDETGHDAWYALFWAGLPMIYGSYAVGMWWAYERYWMWWFDLLGTMAPG